MKTTLLHIPLFLLSLIVGLIACKTTSSTPNTGVTPTPVADSATRFRNPLLSSGPDPWVIFQDGFYYVMHTTGDDLRIYKTKKMSLLGSSTYRAVWSPPGSPPTHDIWAPELHRLTDSQGVARWYIYYAAVVSPRDQHRMWVLENEAADPLTGTWVSKGQVQLPGDRWAIDATSIVLNKQQYMAWSGWENATDNRKQNIYLCKMRDPWTADGPRIRISTPDYDWEKQGDPDVNEGPEFLTHGNKVFLVYSAAHCSTDSYALGMLTADAGADLTNLASWTKSATPVFGPSAANGTYGVGHNSFFTTTDAKENWILYHANPQANQQCNDRRSVRMQPFGWRTDGSPDFGQPAPLTELLKRPSGE